MDALPSFDVVNPRTVNELVAMLAHPESRVLGGGTDLLVNIRRGIVAPPVLVDINAVEELRHIRANAQALEIGASVTLTQIATHPEVIRHYPALAQAAAQIAGPTQRNMGTLGGNLCLDTRCIFYNQSEWWRDANHHCLKTTGDICHVAPGSRGVCFATFSGDLAPALLIIDSQIDIAGPAGRRLMPLADFYIGYARQDEPVIGEARRRQVLFGAAPRRGRRRRAREQCARLAFRLRQNPYSAFHRISGYGCCSGVTARRRESRRFARRFYRDQSAPGAACRHRGAVRRRTR